MAKVTTFSPEEISVFCDQIAMILNGGIPIYEGTHILYEELDEGKTKHTLKTIDDFVKDGLPFHEALKESGAFPVYVTEMVKSGEMTGKLEDIMRSLAKFYDRECAVKASIRSVVGYPTVLLGMMAVVLLVLVGKILPMFADIFLELDGGTGTTIALMHNSVLVAKVISVVVLVLLALLMAGLAWYKFKGDNAVVTSFLNNNPLSAKLADKIAIGKFLATLAVMSAGGMEIIEAVKNASAVVENKRTKEKTKKCPFCFQKITDQESRIFNSLQSKMLGVARVSGSGDTILFKLSEQFDEEIGTRLSSLASIIETALVVILSTVIGAILISVMMPLMSVLSSIG